MKRALFLLLFLPSLLFATGCQSPMITEWLTKSGDAYLQDDFTTSDGTWIQAGSSEGAMDYYQSTYRIWVNRPDYDFWTTPGLNVRDVYLDVDAGRLNGPDGNRYGLICRYIDGQNFYFFVISSDGYYAIGKVYEGEHSLLGQEMMAYHPAINLGMSPNHIRVECVGDMLSLYINDQPVALVTDQDINSGDVGLLAGSFDQPGVDIIFDNFRAVKP